MSREDEAIIRLQSDSAISALFSGGIYSYRSIWSTRQGFTRDLYPDAFDEGGMLLPLIIVKQRGEIPRGDLYDEAENTESTNQVIEVQMYEDSGYIHIELGKPLVMASLTDPNFRFSRAYQARLAFETVPLQDNGSIRGASLVRLDFQVVGLLVLA